MKTAKIACAVLVLLFAAAILNSIYINKVTKEFADAIKETDTENLAETALSLKGTYEKFKKAEKLISITVSHDDLTNIEESFADIIGAAEAGMKVDVITIKSRLEDALRHLGRLSGINFDSII